MLAILDREPLDTFDTEYLTSLKTSYQNDLALLTRRLAFQESRPEFSQDYIKARRTRRQVSETKRQIAAINAALSARYIDDLKCQIAKIDAQIAALWDEFYTFPEPLTNYNALRNETFRAIETLRHERSFLYDTLFSVNSQ